MTMVDSLLAWLVKNAVPLAIIGGIIGFLAKAAYELWLARRKDQLDRVNCPRVLLFNWYQPAPAGA